MSTKITWHADELTMLRDPEGPKEWCVLEGDEIVVELGRDEMAAKKIAGMHNVAVMSAKLTARYAIEDLGRDIAFILGKTSEKLEKEN